MFENEIAALRERIADVEKRESTERSKADALVKDIRESGADLTSPEVFARVDEAYKGADGLKDEAAALRETQRKMLERNGDRAADLVSGASRAATREDREVRDMARRVLESESYQRLRSSGLLTMKAARVHMDPAEMVTREELLASGLRLRTTFDNSSNVGSGLLTPDYTGRLIAELHRRVRFLDVITVGSTDTDTVDYITEQASTSAAAATAYGTAVGESAYGFKHNTTNVRRLGHFVPATKGILADAAQTRTLLSSRLVTGLEREVERQAWAGDGTAENLKGLTAAGVGIGTHARGSDSGTDAVHKAITNIRLAGDGMLEPFAIMISPSDYEKVLLEKDSNGNYIMADPRANGAPTVWGLVPVVTTLVTDGQPVVGDFREACTLWVREGVSVSASDQHADFFLRGLVAIMAETRAAFAVTRPEAACEITGF